MLLLISIIVGFRYEVGFDWSGYVEYFNFLRNNTMCLGEPINSGDTIPGGAGLTKDEQIVVNLFFGANIHHQNG